MPKSIRISLRRNYKKKTDGGKRVHLILYDNPFTDENNFVLLSKTANTYNPPISASELLNDILVNFFAENNITPNK